MSIMGFKERVRGGAATGTLRGLTPSVELLADDSPIRCLCLVPTPRRA